MFVFYDHQCLHPASWRLDPTYIKNQTPYIYISILLGTLLTLSFLLRFSVEYRRRNINIIRAHKGQARWLLSRVRFSISGAVWVAWRVSTRSCRGKFSPSTPTSSYSPSVSFISKHWGWYYGGGAPRRIPAACTQQISTPVSRSRCISVLFIYEASEMLRVCTCLWCGLSSLLQCPIVLLHCYCGVGVFLWRILLLLLLLFDLWSHISAPSLLLLLFY